MTTSTTFRPSAEDSGHVLSKRISPGLRVLGDRDLLAQLFANLIQNALTHTGKGTRIDILVAGRSKETEQVEVVVVDNGPGVPMEQRDKIFQRFYRLEASRTTPGTGLGLALVAAIAKLHGASLAAEDNGPGLRVRLVFRSIDGKPLPETLAKINVPATMRQYQKA